MNLPRIENLNQLNEAFNLYPAGKYDTITAQAIFRLHMMYITFAQEMFDLMKEKPGETREDALACLFESKLYCIATLIEGIQVQPTDQAASEIKPAPKKRGRKPKENKNAH